MKTIENASAVLSAIVLSAETARESGKSSAKTVARFTRKDGITAPAEKVPEGVKIEKADFVKYCKAVQYLYVAACKLNANEDEKNTKALTSSLYTCVKDVLALVDESIEVKEANYVCKRFVSDILASAKTVKLQKSGEELYREENKSIAQFVRTLEANLYVIAYGTTFAADYERDYNRACWAYESNKKKAEATRDALKEATAKALEKLNKAKTGKNQKAVQTAQNEYDALCKDYEANKKRLETIEERKEKAEKAYSEAQKNAKKADKPEAQNETEVKAA